MSKNPYLYVSYNDRLILIKRSKDYDQTVGRVKAAINDCADVPAASIVLQGTVYPANKLFEAPREVWPTFYRELHQDAIVHVKMLAGAHLPLSFPASRVKKKLEDEEIVDQLYQDAEDGQDDAAKVVEEPSENPHRVHQFEDFQQGRSNTNDRDFEPARGKKRAQDDQAMVASSAEPVENPIRKRPRRLFKTVPAQTTSWTNIAPENIVHVNFPDSADEELALKILVTPDTTVKDLKAYIRSRPQLGLSQHKKLSYRHGHNDEPVIEETVDDFEYSVEGHEISVYFD